MLLSISSVGVRKPHQATFDGRVCEAIVFTRPIRAGPAGQRWNTETPRGGPTRRNANRCGDHSRNFRTAQCKEAAERKIRPKRVTLTRGQVHIPATGRGGDRRPCSFCCLLRFFQLAINQQTRGTRRRRRGTFLAVLGGRCGTTSATILEYSDSPDGPSIFGGSIRPIGCEMLVRRFGETAFESKVCPKEQRRLRRSRRIQVPARR